MIANIVLVLIYASAFMVSAKAQTPDFASNTHKIDSLNSTIFKNVHGYNFAISYEASSYWTSDRRDCLILVLKGESYFLYSIHSKRKSDGSWTLFQTEISPFSVSVAHHLIDSLTIKNFWQLNNDSLNNQRTKLYDATNYKIEIATPTAYKIIESYAPEYFLKEEMPWSTERKIFIVCRDLIFNTLTRKQ